ncbi:hypothetical protein M3194_12310 [Paenibacillus glycanilyticus]|uniref:hypothetical protein n=1 Tax=Paenibacillus glycanilyticus TaxID=126569 RepID=UPI0020422E47|nr:hypothetical protein [Paenibacillus glycanilyticus]MCM3628148.1 hypothetical protein [Paenibacillus glycanilyticus]
MEQKEQTFFCHFQCFKELYGDDSTFYLEHIPTALESILENDRLLNQVEELSQYLSQMGEESDLWNVLFDKPSGTWLQLLDLYRGNSDIELKLIEVQDELSAKLLIMWNEDYSSHQRSANCIWRVVLITTEHYEFPCSLLIGRPKGNQSNHSIY